MARQRRNKDISTEKILSIISKCNSQRLLSQTPLIYSKNDITYLFPRLERAAINQIENGDATISRYALWAETVRNCILYGASLFEEGDAECGKNLIIQAANSLSAFYEIQAHFDPDNLSSKDL